MRALYACACAHAELEMTGLGPVINGYLVLYSSVRMEMKYGSCRPLPGSGLKQLFLVFLGIFWLICSIFIYAWIFIVTFRSWSYTAVFEFSSWNQARLR